MPTVRGPRPLFALVVALLAACYQPYQAPYDGPTTPRSHTNFFPIDSGAHRGVDCNACHGAFDTFTRFSCITCHEHDQAAIDPSHVRIDGYVYGESTCFSCHPTGEGMSRAEHTRFPIVRGNHADVTCSECHPQNHQSVACFACHEHTCAEVAPEHDEVTNFSCDSMRCAECHPRGDAEDD